MVQKMYTSANVIHARSSGLILQSHGMGINKNVKGHIILNLLIKSDDHNP